jgi:hypothetical protein
VPSPASFGDGAEDGDGDDDDRPVRERLAELDGLAADAVVQLDEGCGSADDVADQLARVLRGPAGAARVLRVEDVERGTAARRHAPAQLYESWGPTALAPLREVDAARLCSLLLSGLPLVGRGALAPLSELCALRVLRVEHSAALPTEALRSLQRLVRVELASFRGCCSLDDQTVGFLLPMARLRALHLDGTRVGDVALLVASVLPLLARVHVSGTGVSDLGIEVLARRATSLTELSVANCGALTEAALASFARVGGLARLDLSGCANISQQALGAFAAKRPACAVSAPAGLHYTMLLAPPGVGAPRAACALPAFMVTPGCVSAGYSPASAAARPGCAPSGKSRRSES